MKKTEKKSGGDGVWFERGKYWCQYPVATTGPSTRVRGDGAKARIAAKRAYAKAVRYMQSLGPGLKTWLKEKAA